MLMLMFHKIVIVSNVHFVSGENLQATRQMFNLRPLSKFSILTSDLNKPQENSDS
jgi:hypothetical protein